MNQVGTAYALWCGMDKKDKAKVRQSQDKQWLKWCVIYPDKANRNTEWFSSESQALLAADAYNGESYL